ncbi:MAG: NADH-quinone oxidoreductase subunit C, partial [Syntrophales bacterium]|nr:NADH-quinone oxidoreductase subunit C [Syntrophales bacterium]
AGCENLYRRHQLPLKTIVAFDERETAGFFKVMYVFGLPKKNAFLAPYILVEKDFPSLTLSIHEASTYERKIQTFFGLIPRGHPDPRPLILHENWPDTVFPLRKDFPWNLRPETASGEFQFRKISGEGIYEIPVGPVHAGIIEPGHFRFSVAGEEILFLEPRLGYSHKGCEKLFEILSLPDKIKLAERISGDSSYSHSLAFCLALESLNGTATGERKDYLRVVYSELERLANHLGDIGAIMADTGFNFGGAHGARVREIVMQINKRLTGSRFLRGVNVPGGVTKDIAPETLSLLDKELNELNGDFSEVMTVAEDSNSLLNRLKNTGVLPYGIAKDHGVIGVAGKALGIAADARIDYPYAAYDTLAFDVATEKSGDVYARFYVRVREVYSSIGLIKKALKNLRQTGEISASNTSDFRRNSYAVGIVEGWRGDIVYLVATDSSGNISRVDVRDPSFLNWTVLGHAARGNMVPDFPLINKSFNLSYSGNDL